MTYDSMEVARVAFYIVEDSVEKMILKRTNGEYIEIDLSTLGSGGGTGGAMPETPLAVVHGGTGAASAAAALFALGGVDTTDPRLSNARNPNTHASSHNAGGADAVSLDASQIATGTLADARIPSGVARDTEVTSAVSAEAAARDAAISAAINALVAAAPGTMNTLQEISDALGADPNFATTMTTTLAGKLGISGHAANSIVASISGAVGDLAIPPSTFVGRKASGNVAPMTVAEVLTLLGMAAVATSGNYNDLTGKPTLATVATSGSYVDLTSKPTLGALAAKSLVGVADLSFDPATQAELDSHISAATAAHAASAVSVDATSMKTVTHSNVQQALADLDAVARSASLSTRLQSFGDSIADGGGATKPDRGWAEILAGRLRAEPAIYSKGGAVLGWHDVGVAGAQVGVDQPVGDGGWATIANYMRDEIGRSQGGIYWRGLWTSAMTFVPGDGVYDASDNWWVALANVASGGSTPTEGANWHQITSPSSYGAGKYLPLQQLTHFGYGNNDLGWGKVLAVFREVLTSVICRALTGRMFDDNGPLMKFSVPARFVSSSAYRGINLNATAGGGRATDMSGGGIVAGDWFEFQVPADFPGGEVDFFFTNYFATTGTMTVTVDGAAPGAGNARHMGADVGATGALDFSGASRGYTVAGAQNFAQSVVRFKNLASGKHKIRFTITGSTPVWLYFDEVSIMCDPTLRPPVLVSSLIRALSYAAWTAPLPTDSDVNTWNADISAMLASEFPTAVWLDHDSVINKDPSLVYRDQLHLNNKAQAKMAAQAHDALRSVVVSSDVISAISRADHKSTHSGIARATGANHGIPNTNTWTPVSHNGGAGILQRTVRARAGDLLMVKFMGVWNSDPTGMAHWADVCTYDPYNLVNVSYASMIDINTGAQGTNGIVEALINTDGNYHPVLPGVVMLEVAERDIFDGQVTIRILVKNIYLGSGTNTASSFIVMNSGNSAQLVVVNFGNNGIYRPAWAR